MISLAEAKQFVLGSVGVLGPRDFQANQALGLVTASPVVAAQQVPPFANTAMDGFAVRAADTAQTPTRLNVVGTLAAGDVSSVEVGPGQAIRIMTGAPIPAGSDAVVMVEDTESADQDGVLIRRRARAGDHVRPAGDDIMAGAEVFPAGTVLGAGHLGVLASLGVCSLQAIPRPRVGVLSTGDELIEGPDPLRPGQIRDANRPSLIALLAQGGFEPVDLGIAGDSEEEISKSLEHGLGTCDAVLTSGGVSVGDFDYVKVVLDRLSAGTMRWMQVAIKPAKPLAFGTVDGKPVFGLPGNPVSSMVSFELFARPALRKMMGHRDLERPTVDAMADSPLNRSPDGKTHFLRVMAEPDSGGHYHIWASGGQGSHMLWSMAKANALAILPDGEGLPAGEMVKTMLLV